MKYTPYGTDMVYDGKVRDSYMPSRIKMANSGYGLDKLVGDPLSYVREAVARWFKQTDAELDMDILNTLADDKSPEVLIALVESCHNCPDIIEKVANSNNYVTVKAALARVGYRPDYLYETAIAANELIVLAELARNGYMVDELIHYECPDKEIYSGEVKDAAKEYFHAHHIEPYGSNDRLDELADNTNPEIRCAVTATGYGVDVAINDPDWRVRLQAIKKDGFGWYKLINDPNEQVRKECIKQCTIQGINLDFIGKDNNMSKQNENFERLLKDIYNGITLQQEPDGSISMINALDNEKIDAPTLHTVQDVANELIDIMESHLSNSPDIFYDESQLEGISQEELDILAETATLDAYCEFMNKHPNVDVQSGGAIRAARELKESGTDEIVLDDYISENHSKNNKSNRNIERED